MYLKDATLRGLYHRVEWDDVAYVMADKGLLFIWLKGKEIPIKTYISIHKLLVKHPAPDFIVQPHGSYLVNENCIEKVLLADENKIFIDGAPVVQISRNSAYYIKTFKQYTKKVQKQTYVNGETTFINIPRTHKKTKNRPTTNPLDKYWEESVVDVSKLPDKERAEIVQFLLWLKEKD